MLPPSYYSIKIKSGIHFIRYVNAYLNASLLVFENIIEQYRREILHSKLTMEEGKLQVEGKVIHVIVEKCYDLSKVLRRLQGDLENVSPEERNFRARKLLNHFNI